MSSAAARAADVADRRASVIADREAEREQLAADLGFDITYRPSELHWCNPDREGEPWWFWHDIVWCIPKDSLVRLMYWCNQPINFWCKELHCDGTTLVFVPCNRMRKCICEAMARRPRPTTPPVPESDTEVGGPEFSDATACAPLSEQESSVSENLPPIVYQT